MVTYGDVHAIIAVDKVFSPKGPYTTKTRSSPNFFPRDGEESRSMNTFLTYLVMTTTDAMSLKTKYIQETPRILEGLKGVSSDDRKHQVRAWNEAIDAFNQKMRTAFGFSGSIDLPAVNPDTLGFGSDLDAATKRRIRQLFALTQQMEDDIFGTGTERMVAFAEEVGKIQRLRTGRRSRILETFVTDVQPKTQPVFTPRTHAGDQLAALRLQQKELDVAIEELRLAFTPWLESTKQYIRRNKKLEDTAEYLTGLFV